MKTTPIIALILALAAIPFTAMADESPAKQWWARDRSSDEVQRWGDVRRAAKIEITAGAVRFFAESNGRLIVFWQAKGQKTVDAMKYEVENSPSVFLPIGNGTFVNMSAVASIGISKDKKGRETAVLRGITVEIAAIRSADIIKVIRTTTER